MLKLGSKETGIGTTVRCPSCAYPNLGIDIWCERCGGPMESSPAGVAPAATVPEPAVLPDSQPVAHDENGSTPAPDPLPRKPVITLPGLAMSKMPRLSVPSITWPRLSLPSIAWPRLRLPAIVIPRLRPPHVSRLVLVFGAVLAILLIAPIAYVLLPAGRAAVDRQSAASHLGLTNGAMAGETAQSAAIPGVEAKTHFHYQTGKCATNAPCLTVASETIGKDAAAVVFSTATSAGRQCVGYVYRSGGGWHFRDAVCGLPGQLSPLIGHDAIVHLPANCANVREGASLKAHVVACLNAGTTVHIDGGPTYADNRIWWHEPQGWIAHDFLTGP